MSKQVGGMRLEFSGAPEIAAPAEQVWQRLLDHEFVASVAPGVESVEAGGGRHFKVVSAFGVGSGKLRFQLDGGVTDGGPPPRAKLAAPGKAPGAPGDVSA